jgi:ribosomal protein S18 acetylase RimI-like enzyme
MNYQCVLRRAVITDINALSQFYQKAYRETFAEGFSIPYPELDLAIYFRSSASPESFANNLNDPNQAIWVIEDKTNGELIAFAMAGACTADNISYPDVCSNKDGAIHRLYVRRDRQSRGFGRKLMYVMLPWLEEHYPKRPIWLTVWSKNFKAQRFYRHYGFNKVDQFYFRVGEWKDFEFIMKR